MRATLRPIGSALALGALIATGAGACAQETTHDSAALRLRSLAATCAPCHGTDGHALAGALVPGLAAMPAARLIERMRAYRDGTRPATVMDQLARGYSETQVRELAGYFAAQRR